jgi:hypothetical protein
MQPAKFFFRSIIKSKQHASGVILAAELAEIAYAQAQ